MKKILTCLVLCLVVVFMLSSCNIISSLGGNGDSGNSTGGDSNGGDSTGDSATQLTADTTYYNEYLGVEFTVPAGWWIWDIMSDNFNEVEGLTANESGMYIVEYDDGSEYIFMLDVTTQQYTDTPKCINYYIEADRFVGGVNGIDEYMEFYKGYMLADGENTTCELLTTESLTINGKQVEKVLANISYNDGSYEDRHFVSYTIEVNDNWFLNISGYFWPDYSDEGCASAEQLIKDNFVIG